MPDQDCVSEPELERFVRGDLNEQRFTAIAAHVDACDPCQDTVVALAERSDTFISAMKSAGQQEPEGTENALKLGLHRIFDSIRSTPSTPQMRDASELTSELSSERRQIGPYAIEEQLGVGGMGHVYRAQHTRLKRTVALKVLSTNRWVNAAAVSRFEREMEAIGALDHPYIVSASDAGEEQGMHYLVMEFVDGLDLARLVRRTGRLSVADACELARQCAIGLEHAHENGLVHRDIKPSNLMLALDKTEDSAILKILDLGLALLGDEHLQEGPEITTVGTLMGTLDYISPEQGIDSHSVDRRTDVYSLGATLFKLLTGRAPYADPKHSTLMKKMTALATKAAPSVGSVRSDLPAELVSIVDRMLARDPDERFGSAHEVAEALVPFAEAANLKTLLNKSIATEEPEEQPLLSLPIADASKAVAKQGSGAGVQGDNGGGSRKHWLFGAMAGGFLALAAAVLFQIATDFGELVITSDDPTATVLVKQTGKHVGELKIENGEAKLRLRTGRYELEVVGDAKIAVTPSKVNIARSQETEASLHSTNTKQLGAQAALVSRGNKLVPEKLLAKQKSVAEIMKRIDALREEQESKYKRLEELNRYRENLAGLIRIRDLQSKHAEVPPEIQEQIEIILKLAGCTSEEDLNKKEGEAIQQIQDLQVQLEQVAPEFSDSVVELQAVRLKWPVYYDGPSFLRPGSRVLMEAYGLVGAVPLTSEGKSISGIYQVEPSGSVHLGPAYGRVNIAGLTYEEAECAVKLRMDKFHQRIRAMVTEPPREPKEVAAASESNVADEEPQVGSEPTFGGMTYEEAIQALRTERSQPAVLQALQATCALVDGRSTEVVEAVLRAIRFVELSPNNEVVRSLAHLDPGVVVDAISAEYQNGNERSRDFLDSYVFRATFPSYETQRTKAAVRFGDTLKESIPRFAELRVANPNGAAEHKEKIAFLWNYARHFDPSGNTMFKQMLQESFKNEQGFNLDHIHILAERLPNTPGLGEAILNAPMPSDRITELSKKIGDRFDEPVRAMASTLKQDFEDAKKNGKRRFGRVEYNLGRLGLLGSNAKAAMPVVTEILKWAVDEEDEDLASPAAVCILNCDGDLSYVELKLAEAEDAYAQIGGEIKSAKVSRLSPAELQNKQKAILGRLRTLRRLAERQQD